MFDAIFSGIRVIGEVIGLVKPLVDQDAANKKATVNAMKKSSSEPSLSVELNDKHEHYIAELKKDKAAREAAAGEDLDKTIKENKNDSF